ncbi:zinc metalloproteinase nas-6-like [Anabrus simplex]|uniref:zinc metalloproteinase nas-6-like n=1 Tax=Anabrus simplex TaxID=316456 RepID=UPI0035A32D10
MQQFLNICYFEEIQFGRQERNLVASERSLWPDGILYYDFSNEFNETQQKVVEGALEDLEQCTCVRFERRSTQDTYIHLRNTRNGCASPVGFHPTSSGIDLFLSYPGCQRQGTIQHEFLHALGFWHEHTRPDRDNFVTVHWDNIAPGLESNFMKRPESEVQYQQMPYDYDSVMHYRPMAFSKDHQSLTLEPRDATAVKRMGQRIRFSPVDLAKLNRLYNCSSPPYYRGNDLIVKPPEQQLPLYSICKKIKQNQIRILKKPQEF